MCHLIKGPYCLYDLWKKLVTALSELNPVLHSRDRGDERVVPAFEANNDGFDLGVGWCPWNQWLRDWSALCPAQEGLGPYHYFQMTRALSEKKYQVTPGRSKLILTSSPFSCCSNFPSVVSDEGVGFRSPEGLWQFQCPLVCLGGQPEMFKWNWICALQSFRSLTVPYISSWLRAWTISGNNADSVEDLDFPDRFLRKERGTSRTQWLVNPPANVERPLCVKWLCFE